MTLKLNLAGDQKIELHHYSEKKKLLYKNQIKLKIKKKNRQSLVTANRIDKLNLSTKSDNGFYVQKMGLEAANRNGNLRFNYEIRQWVLKVKHCRRELSSMEGSHQNFSVYQCNWIIWNIKYPYHWL